MDIRSHLAALAALALSACGTSQPPRAIDPVLASYVPAGTLLLAGVDLKQLRTTPLYTNLSPSTLEQLAPLRHASYVVVASSGSDFTVLARGEFREAPPGATLIAPNLAIFGGQTRAQGGAPELLAHAEPLAAANPVWAVARGAATLPLSGNLANLNRLLHATDYTTAAARIGDQLSVELAGFCRTADAASHLERTVRAFASLARWDARVDIDNLTVRVAFSLDSKAVQRLVNP